MRKLWGFLAVLGLVSGQLHAVVPHHHHRGESASHVHAGHVHDRVPDYCEIHEHDELGPHDEAPVDAARSASRLVLDQPPAVAIEDAVAFRVIDSKDIALPAWFCVPVANAPPDTVAARGPPKFTRIG